MAAAASVSGACSRAIAPVSVRVTSRSRAAAEPRRARAAMRSIRAQKLNDGVVPVAAWRPPRRETRPVRRTR